MPNDIVGLMVICYNAQHLAYQHLQETNNLVNSFIPELSERDMLKVCVRIYNRIRHIANQGDLDKLLIIAKDGVIDDAERPEDDHILDELREIVRCGLELSVFCDGEEHNQA